MTQGQLAAALGVTRAAVSAWETSKSEPETPRLRAIAEQLGVRFPWLTAAEGAMRPDDQPPAENDAVSFALALRKRIPLGRVLTEDDADRLAKEAADLFIAMRKA